MPDIWDAATQAIVPTEARFTVFHVSEMPRSEFYPREWKYTDARAYPKHCGFCGSTIPKPGPCPGCHDEPSGGRR